MQKPGGAVNAVASSVRANAAIPSGGGLLVTSSGRPEGLGRRLVTNTLHAATGRLAAVVVWLVFSPAILRGLGPEGFGLWALFFAFTGNFGALDFGLVQGTLRHVAAARERGDHAEAGAFASLAVAGFASLAAVWLGLVLLLQGPVLVWLRVPAPLLAEARFALVASAVVFAVTGVANVMISVAQGYGRFDLANVVTLALTAQHAIGIPIVLSKGWGLRGLVINVGLGWGLGALLGLVTLGRAAPGFRWQPLRAVRPLLREAFAFGWPLQFTNVVSVANLHLDKFLLSRFVALAAVTPYEFGMRVASTAMAFPQLLLLAVMPAAAGLHTTEQHGRLRELYERGNRWVLTATAFVLAALLAGGDRLFAVWLGPGHTDAALVLRGLVVALGTAMLAGMASSLARGMARTDLEAWFHAASLSVHLGLSLWLVPRLGLGGALIAIVAGNVAGAATFLWLLAGTLRWPRLTVLLTANAVPVLSVACGAAAGMALGRAFPASGGLAGWLALAAVSGTAALASLVVSALTRFVSLRELQGLLSPAE